MYKLEMRYTDGKDIQEYDIPDTFEQLSDIDLFIENLLRRESYFLKTEYKYITTVHILSFEIIKE